MNTLQVFFNSEEAINASKEMLETLFSRILSAFDSLESLTISLTTKEEALFDELSRAQTPLSYEDIKKLLKINN